MYRLVRRLLPAQFPGRAGLSVEPLASHGTVNGIYRLGQIWLCGCPASRVVPRAWTRSTAGFRCWPRTCPFPVALPGRQGVLGEGYQWPWSGCRWLDGGYPGTVGQSAARAVDLAEFVAAVQRIDTKGVPPAYRSESLATPGCGHARRPGRAAGAIDTVAAATAWVAAPGAPACSGPAVWAPWRPSTRKCARGGRPTQRRHRLRLHGRDRSRRRSARGLVPAVRRREAHLPRRALDPDDATWARERGWALLSALMELSYYRTANPVMAAHARWTIGGVLADHGDGGH